jgi:hypothetical protein
MERDMAQRVAVRSYSTDFELDETPISDRGMWLNGRKDGIDWADVVSHGGVAYGGETRMQAAERRAEQGNLAEADDAADPVGDYDDPTAVLSGEWGRNTARVASTARTRLRSTSRRSRSVFATRSERTGAPATRSSSAV